MKKLLLALCIGAALMTEQPTKAYYLAQPIYTDEFARAFPHIKTAAMRAAFLIMCAGLYATISGAQHLSKNSKKGVPNKTVWHTIGLFSGIATTTLALIAAVVWAQMEAPIAIS